MTARASYISPRRGARVVEWDGLENRCTGNRTVGSNPTLSAIKSLSLQAVNWQPDAIRFAHFAIWFALV